MIFVSTACLKNKYIKDSVLELVNAGFKNIELSGGTKFYDELESDLKELKSKYDINFRCHNYFPPPKKSFVLNLASQDKDLYTKSYNHIQSALKLSKELGAKKFGFHAGYLIFIPAKEFGDKIQKRALNNREDCVRTFANSIESLQKETDIELYVENNALSHNNFQQYEKINPFLLTDFDTYLEIRELVDFNLLLDVGHLKVSTQSLGLSYEDNMDKLIDKTKYLHISDNDGKADLNWAIKGSDTLDLLTKHKSSLKDKTMTLEINTGIEDIIESFEIMESLIK